MTIDPATSGILSAETFRGYVRTRYALTLAGRDWEVRVGRVDAGFDAALRAAGVFQWAFWTAWNPRSQILSNEENRRRQAVAEAELRQSGVAFDSASASSDDRSWPPEPGAVEWNRPAEEALARAHRHGQWAIVAGVPDSPPVLLFNDFPLVEATLQAIAAGGDALAAAARATLLRHGRNP